MDVTRRKVLTLGALTAASSAMPLNAIGQFTGMSYSTNSSQPTKNDFNALAKLTADSFKPWVGGVFQVYSAAPKPALVVLLEVQVPPNLGQATQNSGAAKATTPAPSGQAFALRFQNVSGGTLAQGTYVFENKVLGRFALLVVPSKQGTQPMGYTAQINRSTQ